MEAGRGGEDVSRHFLGRDPNRFTDKEKMAV
jgi:hypothetical protein